jgi:hypothetical protein
MDRSAFSSVLFTLAVFAGGCGGQPDTTKPLPKAVSRAEEPPLEVRPGELLAEAEEVTYVERSAPRYLGYFFLGDSERVQEFAGYTNIVETSQFVIDRISGHVRDSGLKVILWANYNVLTNKTRPDTSFVEALRRHRSIVLAVGLQHAELRDDVLANVATIGQHLKKAVPGAQFWLGVPWGHAGSCATIPLEVDSLCIEVRGDPSPKLLSQVEKGIPLWRDKAAGRPVLIYWQSGFGQSPTWYADGKTSTDFYPPECEPGGIRLLGKLVEDRSLDGLLLDGYDGGKNLGRTFGIRDRRDLVDEVKELSQKWGIGE